MLGGVQERLASSAEHRLGGIAELTVPDHDHLYGHSVVVFDILGGRAERRSKTPLLRPASIAGEPVSELALLTAGQRRHLTWVVGALLHQGEGLEHGVMKVRRELGPLLRANALGALEREIASEPPQERREDQAQRNNHHNRGERRVAKPAEDVIRREEEETRSENQQHPEGAAVELGETRGRLLRWGSGGTGRLARRHGRRLRPSRHSRFGSPCRATGTSPQQDHPERGEHEWPDQRIAPPDPELAEGQQRRKRQ